MGIFRRDRDRSDPPEVAAKLWIAEVFGRTAPVYDSILPFGRDVASDLLTMAKPRAGEAVLDVACGRGPASVLAAAAVGRTGRCVAVDVAPAMLEQLRADHGEAAIVAAATDAEHLAIASRAFDLVVCSYGLQYLFSPGEFLSEVRRVLRPGGRVAIAVPVRVMPNTLGSLYARHLARLPVKTPVAHDVSALLQRHWFAIRSQRTVVHTYRLHGADEWWEWGMTHGYRLFFDALDPKAQRRLRADAAHKLKHTERNGANSFSWTTQLTIAAPT